MANSSVLIALAVIDQLALLAERFVDGILVPEAVWREVVETGKGSRVQKRLPQPHGFQGMK